MLVRDLHHRTLRRLAVIDRHSSIGAAALALCAPGVGLVVVCDEAGNAEGVLSKSDVVRYLTSTPPSSRALPLLMSRTITSCAPEDDLHAVWKAMTHLRHRNIPVLEAGTRPVGILDIRDTMQALFEQEQRLKMMLSDYVAGVGYR